MIPSYRTAIASAVTLAWLLAYIVAVVTLGSWFANGPVWVQLPFYLIAGIAWVFPLKPIMHWAARAYADRDHP